VPGTPGVATAALLTPTAALSMRTEEVAGGVGSSQVPAASEVALASVKWVRVELLL
jgi:hypothetical protein